MIDPDPDAETKVCEDCGVEVDRRIIGEGDVDGMKFTWRCQICGAFLGSERVD